MCFSPKLILPVNALKIGLSKKFKLFWNPLVFLHLLMYGAYRSEPLAFLILQTKLADFPAPSLSGISYVSTHRFLTSFIEDFSLSYSFRDETVTLPVELPDY